MAVIKTRNLIKKYKDLVAVDNGSLEVREGECFGLLGPNGAGKTTLIRMLTAVSPSTGGEIWVLDKDLKKHKEIFLKRGPEHGVDEEAAAKIFDDIEFFANYGFNKCLPADVEVIDAATGRLVRIGDLATGEAHLEQTLTCDMDRLTLQPGTVTEAHENGVKPVYRLTTLRSPTWRRSAG